MDHDLTRRAERAALGAMIADRQLAARLEYLKPEDFTDLDPRHRWVFRTIRQLVTAPEPAPGNRRDLIAKTAGRWVSGRYLDELIASCPNPAHGPAYGAMLVQAAVYRQVREDADRIDAQAASLRTDANRLGQAGAPEAGRAAGIGDLLAETARAIRGHTVALAPPAAGPAAASELASATAVRPRQSTTALAQRREELVLSAVLREHPHAGQILDHLPAAAFTSPDRQEIFRAARRLDHSGRPVDELTVSWELAARSAVSAVLSSETAPGRKALDAYIAKLARQDASSSVSPLQAARDLDAQLRFRTFRHAQPDAAQARDVPAPTAATPLIRPQDPAAGPAGPEPGR